jgi:hypothetical protein
MATLDVRLHEIKDLRRDALVLRNAKQHPRFTAGQRITMIAQCGDVGGEHGYCSRFAASSTGNDGQFIYPLQRFGDRGR